MLDAAPAGPAAIGGASALTVDGAVLNIFWELASVQAAKREARCSACASIAPLRCQGAQSPSAAADGQRTGGCQAARGGAQSRSARV